MERSSSIHTRPTSVVTYRPVPPRALLMALLAVLVFPVVAGGPVLSWLSNVNLRCDHAVGTCSIVSTLGGLTSERSVPLASITGTHLDSFRGKWGYVYKLVLSSTNGDVALSARNSTKAIRERQKAALDRFLADPEAKTFALEYDQGDAATLWPTLALGPCLVLGLVWYVLCYGRLELDWASGTARVVRVRWPLPALVQSFPLRSLRDPHLLTRYPSLFGGNRVTYTVGILIDGERESVPLGAYNGTGPERQEEIVAKIRGLLAQR